MNDNHASFAHKVEPDVGDELAPARGVIIGVVIGIVAWGVISVAAWLLFW